MITTSKQHNDEPDGAMSRSGVWVRLPAERWRHIATEHPELARLRITVLEAIANADYVLEGAVGELLAVRRLDSSKALVVAYRELESRDGFVITAFMTSRVAVLLKRRRQLWPLSN
ncbi:MAG: hypothetical protein WD060_01215 [Pirellulales bacterium]